MRWFIDWLWKRKISRSSLVSLPRILDLPHNKKVLLISPHPDDEVFGCGGTLTLLKRNNCTIRIVVVTDGGKGDPLNKHGGMVCALRRQEVIAAMALLDIKDICFLMEPDGELDVTLASVKKKLDDVYNDFKPDWVFTPSLYETHRDHVGVGYLTILHWIERGFQERVFCYELWGALPTNVLVDITAVIDTKKKLIGQYKIPLSYLEYFSPIMGLAAYRGLLLGDAKITRYAEAFLELPRSGEIYYLLASMLISRP